MLTRRPIICLGTWRYNWRDATSALASTYGLGHSSGGTPIGAALPSIAACGRFLYILNSREGLLKVRCATPLTTNAYRKLSPEKPSR